MNNLRYTFTERAGGRLLVKFSPGSYIRLCLKLTRSDGQWPVILHQV